MTVAENVEQLPMPRGGNYEVARFNALRHGVLSQHTVLPWEDENEYRALIAGLDADHSPQGPTEEHLVEELAGIIWRKRRLRLAEASSYRRGLKRTTEPHGTTVGAALVCVNLTAPLGSVSDALEGNDDEAAEALEDLKECEDSGRQALDILKSGGKGAYGEALAALTEATQEWWDDAVASGQEDARGDQEPYRKSASGLRRFLESEALTWCAKRHKEIENRPFIRAQAFGEAFDPRRLDRLARYEVHLDRKLERTLAMLLKLQELRRAANPS